MRKTLSIPISGVLTLFVLLSLLLPAASADSLYLSLDGLIPHKSDDPATYPILQEPRWYFGTSWSETLNETGFVEGRGVEYYQRYYEHSDMSVEFSVFLFTNVSNAQAYCTKVVNQIRSDGGYTEVQISNVFSVVYSYEAQETGISWGIVSNVVFKVGVYTANIVEDPTERLISFTEMERTRILENGNPNSVPEFISIIILPFFTLATLLGIIVRSKISRKTGPSLAG
jgi:hypothetical protein